MSDIIFLSARPNKDMSRGFWKEEHYLGEEKVEFFNVVPFPRIQDDIKEEAFATFDVNHSTYS